ncbi:MAG: hypothetical protein SW019_05130 [Actinomycetota bacterium]|nr:hypothetical protein [Actinomycetota bacterium]
MRNGGTAQRTIGRGLGAAAHSPAVREHELTIGRGPIGDIAAGSAAVLIANPGDDSVSIAESAGLSFHSRALAGEPVAVLAADDRAYVAITSDEDDAVAVLDLGSGEVLATIPVAFEVTSMAVSPDGKRVYAGQVDAGRVAVAVIDTVAERVGTIELGGGPGANIDALRVDPTGKRVVAAVSDDCGSQLIIIDAETSRVRRVVPVGAPIRDIAHAGTAVYVLTSDRAVGGAVQVIDLSTYTVTDTVELGGAPTQLSMSPDLARAYIVDYDRVAVLCTLRLEIVESLSFGARPSCVTVNADGSRLYVADFAGSVSVFTVSSTIEELYTQFLATDPIITRAPRARELQPTAV